MQGITVGLMVVLHFGSYVAFARLFIVSGAIDLHMLSTDWLNRRVRRIQSKFLTLFALLGEH